jgi:hypothetical protein
MPSTIEAKAPSTDIFPWTETVYLSRGKSEAIRAAQ